MCKAGHHRQSFQIYEKYGIADSVFLGQIIAKRFGVNDKINEIIVKGILNCQTTKRLGFLTEVPVATNCDHPAIKPFLEALSDLSLKVDFAYSMAYLLRQLNTKGAQIDEIGDPDRWVFMTTENGG